MILVITGSRDWTDADRLFRTLDHLTQNLDHKKLWVYIGGAKGADEMAKQWCFKRSVSCKIFHADWDKHGKGAGPIRNQEMVDAAGPKAVCIAFHKNQSRGTGDCIARARKAGMKIRIIKG